MSKHTAQSKRFKTLPFAVMGALAVSFALLFGLTHVNPAQAVVGEDNLTAIGVSENASTAQLSSDVADKFSDDSESNVSALTSSSTRTSYAVQSIGPTDVGSLTAGITMEDGTVVVTQDEGWQVGSASAYTLADNDGWDATASGVKLTENSMTVAVPSNRLDLIGRKVEIYYNGKTVTATVTDTGGFAPLGRDLDLAGGVWRAFGATSTDGWGVRTVSYRFL